MTVRCLWLPRRRASLHLLVAAAILASCHHDNMPPSGDDPLQTIPAPRLEALDAPVRDRLAAARAEAAAAIASAASDVERGQAVGRLAMTYHAHDLDSAARAAYLKAIELDPDNVDHLYLGGRLALAHGRAAEARELLAAAANAASDDGAVRAAVLAALSEAQRALGDPVSALATADRAVSVAPRSVTALVAQAESAADAGALERASFAYAKALELQPQASKLRAPYAGVLRRLGQQGEAAEQIALSGYGLPAEEDALLAEVAALRAGGKVRALEGAQLIEAGRLADAIATLEHAIADDPLDADARSNLAVALLRSGRAEESIAHLREVARMQPKSARPLLYLGSIQAGLGRHDEAAQSYQQAIDIDSGQLDARLGLGAALLALGDLERAESEFAAVVAADGSRAGGWLGQAATQVRLGRAADARATLDRGTARVAGDWRLEAAWCRVAATASDLSATDASRALERARALPVEHPLALEALAMALAATGDFPGAVVAQRKAIALVARQSVPGARSALELRLLANLERYRQGFRATDPALE